MNESRTEGPIFGYYGLEEKRKTPLTPLAQAGATVLAVLGMAVGVNACINKFYQAMEDGITTSWSNSALARLEGTESLLPSEKRYPKVRVVMAAESLADRLEMERDNPWVNVRNYPGSYYPNIGGYTKKIGKVSIGSEIYDVILTPMPYSSGQEYWGFTYCDNIKGLVPNDPSQEKPRICAIHYDYLKGD